MNPIQIKQHELERPTYAWCPQCDMWNIISMQGSLHVCNPKDPLPTQPWREKEYNEPDRLDESREPS